LLLHLHADPELFPNRFGKRDGARQAACGIAAAGSWLRPT